jgi:hypothetical protein
MEKYYREKTGIQSAMLLVLRRWILEVGIDPGPELAAADHFLEVADDGAPGHPKLPRQRRNVRPLARVADEFTNAVLSVVATTLQPSSQTILAGRTATLGVVVSAPGPLTYQWQFNGSNLPTSIITTVAGKQDEGYSGDGGPATNASLTLPHGVAVDAFGNLFIADTDNNRIREVGTNGIITTVVGKSGSGYTGDGGAATNANLNQPSSVAVDSFGNLFIADTENNRIRKVGTNGIITTAAGKQGDGYSGDGGAATNATLNFPAGVAVDAFGNLFIADTDNNRIRMVGTNGVIITVAGKTAGGYSGDGGPATNANLNQPSGVAVDSFGNLFIADSNNRRVREVAINGIISTVAGTGGAGYSGDGG